MENKDKNNVYYRLLLIAAIIIPVIIGFSYAYFLAVVQGTENPTTIQGTVIDDLIFDLQTENNGYINATGIFPLNQDEVDTNASRGTFTVVSGNNAYGITYTLSLTDISIPTELKNEYFKWRLVCTSCIDTSKNAEGNFANSTTELTLKTNNLIAPNSSDTYDLLIWLDNASNVDQTSAMNKSFSAKVQATAEFTNDKTIVTFDANGGTTPLSSKLVTYGESYGTLPTPTRAGYTFKGWNGKNLFNEEKILMAIDGTTYENGYYEFTGKNGYFLYGGDNKYPIEFKSGTQYTLTVIGHMLQDGDNYIFQFNYTDGTINQEADNIRIAEITDHKYTVTSRPSKDVMNLKARYKKIGIKVYISKVQLEEGTEATEYEPYYITSNTTVVQNNNHTLKAIWEANS